MVNKGWLNLKNAAAYLDISPSKARKEWPSWIDWGVNPSRDPNKKKAPIFVRVSELDRMREQQAVMIATKGAT